MDINNRIGKFKIHHDLIKENPKGILKLMSKVIIVRAESYFVGGVIEYQALSEHFRELKVGEVIPEYTAVFDKENKTITFEEVE